MTNIDKQFAGIDFSMTSPSVTIYNNSLDFNFMNTQTFFLSSKQKYVGKYGNIVGEYYKPVIDDIERYKYLSNWVISKFSNIHKVFLEGYSFSSKGMVFNIGENTGILKYKLNANEIQYQIISPSKIKKDATGKGNANKEVMQESFVEKTSLDLKKMLNQSVKSWNPSSDIIDSFYILESGLKMDKII